MLNPEQRQKLIKSAKERKWCYIGKIDAPMPEWNDIFFSIEELRPTKNWVKKPNLNFQLLKTSKIDPAENIRKYINEIFHKNVVTCHIYFAIANEGSGSLKLHRDSMDVIYIQGINRTVMNIRDGKYHDSEILFDQVFEPGDMIYIPAGTAHEIIAFEPRASLSIGVEYIEDVYPPDYL